MAARVELPNRGFPNRFRPALQYVEEYYHVGEVSETAVGASFLECLAQSQQLASIESPSKGFVRFEQLTLHDTKLIQPNT